MIGEEEINEDWFLLDVEQAIELIRVKQLGRMQAQTLLSGMEHYQEAYNLGKDYDILLTNLREAVQAMPQNPLD
jgi:hypothetical protein